MDRALKLTLFKIGFEVKQSCQLLLATRYFDFFCQGKFVLTCVHILVVSTN